MKNWLRRKKQEFNITASEKKLLFNILCMSAMNAITWLKNFQGNLK